jgi:hypothetical protein
LNEYGNANVVGKRQSSKYLCILSRLVDKGEILFARRWGSKCSAWRMAAQDGFLKPTFYAFVRIYIDFHKFVTYDCELGG